MDTIVAVRVRILSGRRRLPTKLRIESSKAWTNGRSRGQQPRFNGMFEILSKSPQPTVMSPLSRTAGARLIAAAARPTISQRAPCLVRYGETAAHNPPREAGGQQGRPVEDTSEPPAKKVHEAGGLMRQEGPSEGAPRHKPDYNVAADYRTS